MRRISDDQPPKSRTFAGLDPPWRRSSRLMPEHRYASAKGSLPRLQQWLDGQRNRHDRDHNEVALVHPISVAGWFQHHLGLRLTC